MKSATGFPRKYRGLNALIQTLEKEGNHLFVNVCLTREDKRVFKRDSLKSPPRNLSPRVQ